MKKIFQTSTGKTVEVKLKKIAGFYAVYVNDDLYYKSANELFAVQRFNAI